MRIGKQLWKMTRSSPVVQARRSAMKAAPAILILLRAAYLPVLSTLLTACVCVDYGDVAYLRHAPEIECWTLVHFRMLAMSVAMFLGFTLGFPAAIFAILRYGRRNHLLANPSFASKFRILYEPYEDVSAAPPGYIYGKVSKVSKCAGSW